MIATNNPSRTQAKKREIKHWQGALSEVFGSLVTEKRKQKVAITWQRKYKS